MMCISYRMLLLAVFFVSPCLADERAPAVAKRVLKPDASGENLLKTNAWRPVELGFDRDGDSFVCDNGSDRRARRGVVQTVRLDQVRPEPILAALSSKAQGVSGGSHADYSLYLDLIYTDGTPLWGQIAGFAKGTHDWQRRRVTVVPEKPVRSVTFYMLLRGHAGKAWFRDPHLQVLDSPSGTFRFDSVVVEKTARPHAGFQIRDVAAGSDFVKIDRQALGVALDCRQTRHSGATLFDVTLRDTTGRDRAVTLVYSVPVARAGLRWLADPRRSVPVESGREYLDAVAFDAGANGRLSRYPLGAVGEGDSGTALGIDVARPAFFRVGYNAAAGELFLAYDVGLVPEKPAARLRFCRFDFDPSWGFRAALARYYGLFAESFRCRTPEQGLWMPFAKISEVEGWEDFGFKFKEGNNETGWDDAHGIVTFRYTEPMTWWMRMPPAMPRTYEAALAEARRQAEADGNAAAKALLTSGYHDAEGKMPARLLDLPWCDGAVWSMNSMPGIRGDVTDFSNKWNATLRRQLYAPDAAAVLDGEYVDSSEGYVTDQLDFRRDHFAAADLPLTFSPHDARPAIFRGLIAAEYVRGIARDVHAMDRLMMANSTPGRLCWLAPWLDVMGTETNWNPGGVWRPMTDRELLYRRALCKGKPFCFLMNTPFEQFSHAAVEKYMKRCLAYGMFPGFFSHNAAEGQYFTRPELYDRDRPLFVKYVPLCKRVAQAGWEPITAARTDDANVYVERFGTRILTVLNDSDRRRTVTIRLESAVTETGRDLVAGEPVTWQDGRATLTLDAEDVAVIVLSAPLRTSP